ncbi:MAG: DUF1552 domain-containing protein [Pirellulaceae bacterium]|jgi:hypothetical protein|nr:DUF1552 domain-containing protein [Planctomycetaceae bacterium]
MSQQQIARRTFLRGVGLTMGLPLLDAMMGATAHAAAASPPVRAAFVFFPNGAIMPSWKPTGEGEQYELSETISVIERHRSDFNVLTSLAQDNGRAKGDGAGDHARCSSTFLTGSHPVKTSGADIKVGVSVDQMAAEKIGHLTKLPSLELGIENGRNAGSCDSGYSCAYSNNVSWKNPSTPMAKEVNPRLAFERLFGSRGDTKSAKERDFYRKSILDYVQQDAVLLRQRLGKTDRRKMEEYFQSVRELEKRIAQSAVKPGRDLPADVESPTGVPDNLEEHIKLMYDLMVLAFRTDTTRIASFMLGNAGSNRAYRMVGVDGGHHELSHHRDDEEKVEQLQKVDGFLIKQFGYFLDQLKAIPEGNGNLLDQSIVLYGSGLSDANRHRHDDLPVILAGKAGGSIQTGRHLVMQSETPMNNLFLSILDRLGAEVESIGDSSGRLTVLS